MLPRTIEQELMANRTKLPRRSKRLRGASPDLVWACLEKLLGDHFSTMSVKSMDYEAMRQVYHYSRIRKGFRIQQFVRNYGETYFRELIQTIQKEAWQLAMDPDVLAKLTKVSGNLRRSAEQQRINSILQQLLKK